MSSLIAIENSLFESDQISKRQFIYNIKKQKLFYVANIDNQVAGYILCFEYKKVIRVYSLAIAKTHQGKGVGKALLMNVCDNTSKNMFLEVNVNNTNAIALYEKLSFITYKQIPNYYQNGDTALRMILLK